MLKCRFELVPGFEMCSIYSTSIPTQPISNAIIESLEVARLGPTQIVRTRHIFFINDAVLSSVVQLLLSHYYYSIRHMGLIRCLCSTTPFLNNKHSWALYSVYSPMKICFDISVISKKLGMNLQTKASIE